MGALGNFLLPTIFLELWDEKISFNTLFFGLYGRYLLGYWAYIYMIELILADLTTTHFDPRGLKYRYVWFLWWLFLIFYQKHSHLSLSEICDFEPDGLAWVWRYTVCTMLCCIVRPPCWLGSKALWHEGKGEKRRRVKISRLPFVQALIILWICFDCNSTYVSSSLEIIYAADSWLPCLRTSGSVLDWTLVYNIDWVLGSDIDC